MAIRTFWLKDPTEDNGGNIHCFQCSAKRPYREEYKQLHPEPNYDPKDHYRNSDHDVWQRNFLTWLRNQEGVSETRLGEL